MHCSRCTQNHTYTTKEREQRLITTEPTIPLVYNVLRTIGIVNLKKAKINVLDVKIQEANATNTNFNIWPEIELCILRPFKENMLLF
mmetsp:Transcript_21423/g.32719  ORF Transcript_21423/g.32719 Transcript_21423/m.32719 type:complete len:87 (+) Transcript_21423:870-1130(+)